MELSKCTQCSLCKHRTNVVMPIIKGRAPRIFFLGEAPGRQENEQGKPFVGRAGEQHWKFAKKLEVDHTCIVMNTVQCRPVELSGEVVIGNGKPTDYQMKKCEIWVRKVMEEYKYNFDLVILYGTYPIRQMLDLYSPIKRWVGKFYESDNWKGLTFFACYHPSTLDRNSIKYLPIWEKHIKLIRNYLYNK